MTKLEYLLMYQKADLKKQQLENNLRTTESRQKLNRITKLLREQQTAIQKLTEASLSLMIAWELTGTFPPIRLIFLRKIPSMLCLKTSIAHLIST